MSKKQNAKPRPAQGTEVVAVIPARGGSKGVPGKNVAAVGGIPLVARAVKACRAASSVTSVVVSTDDDAIAGVARQAGAIVVTRPADLAGDTASSESAVVHALDVLYGKKAAELDVVVMVQCTSPFLTAAEIDGVVDAVRDGADTAFTAAVFHGFVWRSGPDGAQGVNHEGKHRARRQDRPAELLETGAAYAMRAGKFLDKGRRFFGTIRPVVTDPARVLEIDEPADLERARALAPLLDGPDGRPARGDVDAVVLDFDGTQTDDRAWIGADGSEQVVVHRGDGMGVVGGELRIDQIRYGE